MSKSHLYRCLRCHLQPSGVLLKILKDKEKRVTKKYFVLCACQKRALFDSKLEAFSAWNKANAP
jgi:hypothetical protein